MCACASAGGLGAEIDNFAVRVVESVLEVFLVVKHYVLVLKRALREGELVARDSFISRGNTDWVLTATHALSDQPLPDGFVISAVMWFGNSLVLGLPNEYVLFNPANGQVRHRICVFTVVDSGSCVSRVYCVYLLCVHISCVHIFVYCVLHMNTRVYSFTSCDSANRAPSLPFHRTII